MSDPRWMTEERRLDLSIGDHPDRDELLYQHAQAADERIAALEAERDKAVGLLKDTMWNDTESGEYCSYCGGGHTDPRRCYIGQKPGHTDDCEMDALLARLEARIDGECSGTDVP